MQLPFTKMHGLGNDFMVIDLVNHKASLGPDLIRQLADRHFGIGFDQLLLIMPPTSSDVDFDYRIYNADGNEVEHCGNGARCFALYVRDKGLSRKNPLTVGTINNKLELKIEPDNSVIVDMGVPRFALEQIPFRSNEQATVHKRMISLASGSLQVEFVALSMGNPHAVLLVEDVDNADVVEIGTALGSHPDFPQGVNVGFMQIIDAGHVKLRVYERGAGETLACGTGACAAMVAGCVLGRLNDTVQISLRGGELTVKWPGKNSPVLMRGPATTVFEGMIQI
ncbi:MAG: diaminopimelate epimerase [Pseudohongiellaceae bacterium]